MMRMVANKAMTYRTRRLSAGDLFDVRDLPARLLCRTGKARYADDRPVVYVEEPRVSLPSIDGDDLDVLRATARALSIRVDGRWSVKRLQLEIARARS